LKAKYLAAIYLLIDLFGGFSGSKDGVAHWAHLGGFVMGLILMIVWIRRSGSRSF
jgi:membrane associated rhomboid family serine protease